MKRKVWSVVCDGRASGAPEAPCPSWVGQEESPAEAAAFARGLGWKVDGKVAYCTRCQQGQVVAVWPVHQSDPDAASRMAARLAAGGQL